MDYSALTQQKDLTNEEYLEGILTAIEIIINSDNYEWDIGMLYPNEECCASKRVLEDFVNQVRNKTLDINISNVEINDRIKNLRNQFFI